MAKQVIGSFRDRHPAVHPCLSGIDYDPNAIVSAQCSARIGVKRMTSTPETAQVHFSKLQWVFVTSLSWALGWAVALPLFPRILSRLSIANGSSETYYFLVIPATAGAIVGIGQWLYLRRHLDGSWRWVPAMLLAMTLSVMALVGTITRVLWGGEREFALPGLSFFLGPPAVAGLFGGAIAGTIQWVLLRAQSGTGALHLLALVTGWAGALIVLGVAGLGTFMLAATGFNASPILLGAISGGLGGAVIGISSGFGVESAVKLANLE